jgi:hypothetical protein
MVTKLTLSQKTLTPTWDAPFDIDNSPRLTGLPSELSVHCADDSGSPDRSRNTQKPREHEEAIAP